MNALLKGANKERTAILAKVRREVKHSADKCSIDGPMLIQWLLGRNERYGKKKGGL
jgi:hypothetical protein